MKNPKFQLYKDNRGEYRFRLLAVNGQNILHSSEGYTTKQNCQNAISSVKLNARNDHRYLRKNAVNQQFYFTFHATNGKVLAMSEMCSSSYARENGVIAVKRDAPIAPVEDLSFKLRLHR